MGKYYILPYFDTVLLVVQHKPIAIIIYKNRMNNTIFYALDGTEQNSRFVLIVIVNSIKSQFLYFYILCFLYKFVLSIILKLL